MQLGLLGPLEVRVGDHEVSIAGSRLRSLLCRLAVEPGRSVPASALVEAVWTDDPPAEAANALQSLVSRLRRSLGGPTVITQEVTGYRLALVPDDLDATVLAGRLSSARTLRASGDLDGAYEAICAGLALWRGEPLSDAGTPTMPRRIGHAGPTCTASPYGSGSTWTWSVALDCPW